MLRTLAFLVGLVGICQGTNIVYPQAGSPCVLLDVTANNSLVWTNRDGKQTMVPTWSFADSSVHNGGCAPSPFVEVRWADSGAFQYTFSNVSGMVELSMEFSIVPNFISAFTNSTDANRLSATQKIQLGSADKSYQCNDLQPLTFKMSGGDKNKYEAVLHFMTFKAQGFNVINGTYSQAEDCKAFTTTPEPVTTQPPEEPTTEPPTTKPTKPVTKPEEPTTEPPPETTTQPKTNPTEPITSEAPTTEPPAPMTTNHTELPTTKHTEPPITKPVTTQPPITPGNHPKQTFRVVSGDNNCMYMVGEFLFSVPYTKKDNTTATASVGLQEVKSVTGTCNGTGNTNKMMVDFHDDWHLDITFSTAGSKMLGDDDSNKFWWSLVNLTYTYNTDLMPDLKTDMVGSKASASTNQTLFKASKDSSYLCNSDTSVQLSDSVSMTTYNLQYDAFNTGKNQTKFDGDPTQCSADEKTNSIVPIAVGAALAGLVVIVLIAYLIGRRRNRKGYESV